MICVESIIYYEGNYSKGQCECEYEIIFEKCMLDLRLNRKDTFSLYC